MSQNWENAEVLRSPMEVCWLFDYDIDLEKLHNLCRSTTCDLLRQITTSVLRDESRHVAFGNVYVGEAIRRMHVDDRENVAQFAFEAVKAMSDAQGGPDGSGPRKQDPGFVNVLHHVGIDPFEFVRDLKESSAAGLREKVPPGQIYSFRDLMMPALVRVGAVTGRTRELFADAKIPVWDDTTTLESLEDADTGDIGLAEAS